MMYGAMKEEEEKEKEKLQNVSLCLVWNFVTWNEKDLHYQIIQSEIIKRVIVISLFVLRVSVRISASFLEEKKLLDL
jgi:hypothetical protein